jgi:membrane dipeptidase
LKAIVMQSSFDFGLSQEQEERAAQLHEASVIVDLMSQHAGCTIFQQYPPHLQLEFQERMRCRRGGFDSFLEALYWPYEMSMQGKSNLLLEWYRASGLTCGTYGIDVHDGHDEQAREYEMRVARYANLPWLRYVTTAGEIRAAKRAGVIAFYASCQPTTPLPRDLKPIDTAYAKGLRSLMLTYNLMDNVGVGCTERVDAGLSSFGVQVVKHCNDIGMMIDVSHCGPLTTLDACRHSKGPVNANHTAARRLHRHVRGKSDEALRAIAATGGVVGIVALPSYLTTTADATIEHMLNHIDYICDLIGWQHVAIGTDWPLQAPEPIVRELLSPENAALGFRPQDELDVARRLIGFDDCRDLRNITRGLVKRGYTDEQIQGIVGENALRVIEHVCG